MNEWTLNLDPKIIQGLSMILNVAWDGKKKKKNESDSCGRSEAEPLEV